MKLIVEMDADEYERFEPGVPLDGPVEEVEIRQKDGLLSQVVGARDVIPVFSVVAQSLGIPLGRGPVIRVFTKARKEVAGGSRSDDDPSRA